MSLEKIAALSVKYGSDPRFVLAGGGNTSYKDETFLFIKPSGIALSEIRPDQFVKMERAKIQRMFSEPLPEDVAKREAAAKEMMMGAVSRESSGRPSVEAPLHEVIPFSYVVHLHPAAVNGMTCSENGEKACAQLFPEALWIPYVDPGYTLSGKVFDGISQYRTANGGKVPNLIFLQNHGVFAGADTPEEIDSLYASVMSTLSKAYAGAGVSPELVRGNADMEAVKQYAPKLRTLLGTESEDGAIERKFVVCAGAFDVADGPLSPDHIVYAKSFPMVSTSPKKEEVAAYVKANGFKPLVVNVPDKGVFCASDTLKGARTVAALAADAALVKQLTAAFGGPRYLSERDRLFIENWEVESYRRSLAGKSGSAACGRLKGRVAVVTGAAQGFGYGIAEELAREGAVIVVADMNLEGADKAAEAIRAEYPASEAFAVAVNVADEASVSAMVGSVAERCGGIDLFVANAGVLKAGSVKTFTLKDWEFVTDVNYNGYFLCVKHVSSLMAAETADGGDWLDIVQVNSKSGLQGSNKNAAYAGGKFGGIGLTQSFAMELVADRIKVNSVCPGNYFDGPLWSNPERGLFVQYLNSGKVPGAKTVEDVKRFYESKVPMNRGCFPADVARAILYSVEQKYETGQAIPVTGGQVMLK
ncbi:MAG: Sorbitol-6-phosphate 2-dehydrogenase [Lentisphaerae bacterium ADurb.Bin242]|nr:MAG: Sorbitol-6-phosphate 2-dehydrogenase [Lentisphaerae bacterium ADurb.Bin242]